MEDSLSKVQPREREEASYVSFFLEENVNIPLLLILRVGPSLFHTPSDMGHQILDLTATDVSLFDLVRACL